ncbi:MAG: DUF4177 domain-containing protein [Eubacteriaceae bacterium]
MDKFEYKTLTFETKGFFGGKLDGNSFDEQLMQYGKYGWELISTFTSNQEGWSTKKVFVVFKRALP